MSRPLIAAACLVALACGHAASTSSALHEPPPVETIPVAASTAPIEAALPAPAEPAPTERARTKPPSATGAPCIEVDAELGGTRVTLEGRVFVDNAHEHPSRGKTHPYILRLDAPRCVIGADEVHVSEVHLASTEDVQLKALVGRHVRVSGDPFTAHTAWHARPIVLMTTSATTGG